MYGKVKRSVRMTNSIKIEAMTIVENYLMDNPNPSNQDWKSLINTHPEFAKEIAEAAVFQSSFDDAINEEDMVFDQASYDATISRVLNLVHKASSPAILEANQKLEAIKGPQIKSISVGIGIGSNPSLLNGVLAGRIIPPNKVLVSISNYLELSTALLTQIFQTKSEQLAVPSFKSSENKPELRIKPKQWEEAVRELELSHDETTRLLKFAEAGSD